MEPGDGWSPLCAALDLPVPDEPFPRVNTSADWDPAPDRESRRPGQGAGTALRLTWPRLAGHDYS
ncbi:sulfotransferase [Nocardioides immobilis]|uniref:sulfotransferase n=1 Tax=Nocardioides immobilis TaxID=2049295 RepID=UPI0015FCC348